MAFAPGEAHVRYQEKKLLKEQLGIEMCLQGGGGVTVFESVQEASACRTWGYGLDFFTEQLPK